MPVIQKITPCLWFDDQAEEAASFIPLSSRIPRIVKLLGTAKLDGGPRKTAGNGNDRGV